MQTKQMSGEKNKTWKGTTFGNRFMLQSLTWMLKWVDVRIVYAFVAIFVIPFTCLLPSSRHAYRFLRQAIGYGRIKALCGTYKNLVLFSQVVIDRFAMYAGKKFDIELEGYEHFCRLAKEDDGFVQLSAHVGNYELAGYTLIAEDKTMNALVFGGEKQTVMEGREQMFGTNNIKMIAMRQDMSHIFDINQALAGGEIVSMPADRLFGSTKSVEVKFFGGEVALPVGPFQVAAMRGCNVLAVNVVKSAVKTYTIYVTPLCYDKDNGRQQQIQQIAQAYASELERVLRLYPHQWYNYFDFVHQ